MKRLIVAVLILSTISILSACGGTSTQEGQNVSKGGSVGAPAVDNGLVQESPSLNDSSTVNGLAPLDNNGFAVSSGQKIIFNADIALETTNFSKAISDLKTLVSGYNGYIASSNITGSQIDRNNLRSASFTIKIPQVSFDSSKEKIEVLGNLTSSNSSSQDITKQFVDTEARIKTLKVEEERLLVLLGKAIKLEDVITLESRLSEIRLEIESYTGSLNEMKAQTDYGTINVYISEVKELTLQENGFLNNIVSAFKGSFSSLIIAIEGGIIGLIYVIPYLIIIAIIIIAVKKSGIGKNVKFRKEKNGKEKE